MYFLSRLRLAHNGLCLILSDEYFLSFPFSNLENITASKLTGVVTIHLLAKEKKDNECACALLFNFCFKLN